MKNLTTILHKNKQIIYLNFSGVQGREFIVNVTMCNSIVMKTYSNALGLANYSNIDFTKELQDFLKTKEMVAGLKCYKKFAVVGLTQMQKMFLNTYNVCLKLIHHVSNEVYFFNTEEEAKEWLVK
jgi:hypothetical protein